MADKNDGSVIIKVNLNLDDFNKTEKESEKLASNLTKNFSKAGQSVANGIKKAFDVTLNAIAVTSAAVTAASALGINYNMEMENYLADFSVMLGDTERAAGHLDKLKTMAAKTPFEMTDLAQADKVLLAFGSDAEEVQGQLQMLGDISLGNSQKLGTLATAFGRIQSNGRASLEEINMMIDQGFNPLNIIAETTGETMQEVRDRVSKGAVSFEEISAAMKVATSEGGQFYKGMEVASKTASGQISTLKDNVNALLGDMTKGLFDGLKNELLPRVTEAVEDIHEAFNTGGAGAAIDTASNILTEFIGEIAKKAPGAIGDMLKTILPKLKQAGRTMILSLVEAMLGEDIAKQLGRVFEAFDDIFAGIVQIISDHSDEIAGLIESVVEIILDIAEFALPLLADAVEWLSDNLDEMIPYLELAATGFLAFKAVTGISSIISGITSAFSGLNAVLMANPIAATIGLITAALGGIMAIDNAVSNRIQEDAAAFAALSEEEQEAIDRTREYIDTWEEVKNTSNERAEAAEAEYGYYQQLSDELKTIVDENGKIKEGYEERAKVITTQLSDALGIEIDIVDGQIEGYQVLQEEIDKTIEKKLAEAQLDAFRDQYNEALEKRNQLEKDHLTALDALNRKTKERDKLQKDYNEAMRQWTELGYVESELMEEIGGDWETARARLEALDVTIEEATVAVQESEQAYLENKATLQLYGDALAALESGEMQDFNDAILMIGDSMLTAETASEESLKSQLDTQRDILEQMEQSMRDGSLAITQAEIDEQKRRVELAEEEYEKAANVAYEGAQDAMNSYTQGIEEGGPPASEAMSNAINAVRKEAELDLEDEGKESIQTFADGMKKGARFVEDAANYILGLAGRKVTVGGDYSYNAFPSGPGSEGVSVLSYRPIEIPQLAKGTVIPPNAPYLAVVGDQRHGTNIEAPLDTIKQAVAETLAETGGGSGGRQIVIPVYISGRQVYEAVVEENDLNTIATGRNAFA